MKQVLIITLTFLSLSILANLDDYMRITWKELVPSKLNFEDPFADLDPDVLGNLSFVARVELMLEKKPETVTEELKKKADEKRKALIEQGIDVDYLISIRFEIAEKRRKLAESVVEGLNGSQIKIAGYLLPLNFNGSTTKEFLLVPEVGACIHTPPPPRNQIIFVDFPKGYSSQSNFEPVWVSGTLRTTVLSNNLYLKDGSSEITSAYSLEAVKVEKY